jgi:hypothetical protein
VNVTPGRYRRLAAGAATLAVVAVLTSGCSRSDATQAPPSATGSASASASRSAPASPSATPASPYEDDPGVKTMRAYYAAIAKAINARNLRLPELVALSGRELAARTPSTLDVELGNRAPGPVPFTPTAVRSNGPRSRTVLLCVLDDGWTVNPKTGKLARPRNVIAGRADLVKVGGRWKVDALTRASFSCTGVTV